MTQQSVLDLLDDLRADLGLDVWLISHDLPLVASRSDDLAVISAGRIVENGPTATVLSRPRHPHTKELLAAFDGLQAPPDPQPAAAEPGTSEAASSGAAATEPRAAEAKLGGPGPAEGVR